MQGQKAPDFSIPATGDATFRLSDHKGHPVVLYFYPKDNTPGCTVEGADFRDLHDDFAAQGAVVAGISAQPQVARRIQGEDGLPFSLLSDADEALCTLRRHGEDMAARKCAASSTALFDDAGVLVKEWRGVSARACGQVLAAVKAL
jgi:peroxiredoxin Q/BCP